MCLFVKNLFLTTFEPPKLRDLAPKISEKIQGYSGIVRKHFPPIFRQKIFFAVNTSRKHTHIYISENIKIIIIAMEKIDRSIL